MKALPELLVDLFLARGIRSIKDRPDCIELQIDEQWWVAFHGQLNPLKCSKGVTVHPGEVYVEYNGWPAGTVNLFNGEGILAAGAAANERTFRKAIRTAMKP